MQGAGGHSGALVPRTCAMTRGGLALLLYLATSVAILLWWDRFVQRVSYVAAIVLIALPLSFTGRAMLVGRTLAPVDIAFAAEPLRDYASDYGIGVPHERGLSDLHCQILPWQRAVRYSLSHGQWPLWNPFILGGDILAAAAQPAVYDPFQWIGMLIPLVDAFTFGVTLTFFLAGFFAWAFARALGLSEVAAFTAAAGFMFCGMMAFFAGWPLGRSWAYLPLVLFATRRVVREGRAALLALAFVLVIVSGHPESVLHIVAAGAAYGLFEWMRVRTMRPLLLALGAGIVAILLTAVYLLPFFEAIPQTLEHRIRRDLYGPRHHRPDRQIGRALRPHPAHVPPRFPRHGAAHRAGGTGRAGAGHRRRRLVFPAARDLVLSRLTLIGFSATWGTPPFAQLLHRLPLFDIAINERLAFAAALSLAMLAAFAVDALDRHRGLVLILFAVVLVQRVHEDGAFYPALPREAFFPRVPLIARIPRDARMTAAGFAFTGNNPTMYALEDARGYQAMTNLRLYETYPLWSTYQRAWFNRVDDLSRPFLSFLNVRYAIGQGDAPEGWRLLAEDRGARLFENLHELPRAFVPPRIRYERGGAPVLKAMQSATDFSQLAWIEAPEYEPHEIANGPGQVTLRRTGLAYEMDVSLAHDGWVVVSATAWKGWRARVDGHRVEPRFANHAFLGVFVPRGTHRVTLDYFPRSFVVGRAMSLATLAVIAALFFGRIARTCRRSFSTFPSRSA